ncbi:hypothetical protein [Pontibacter akesuensis]|uniref:Uncharacterized protein n=1 Tax=Pontibacter akesuensis TaxID=388950 RepID=A0A1I7KVB2_9BACT|nr:hypothetical protein [Pontibacter akesuensis]GHA78286.1 hypothetical protein GCM10007389_35400 [Pontibacter akesuensis]SFV01318.1 hypothetical protein SAMN04487941_4145 [Pontibacter akesuensis]
MKREIKLNDIPKRQPYQVPDGYFDKLPMQVMARTVAPEAPAPWLEQVWRPMRLAIAPLLLLLVFVGVYFVNTQQAAQPAPATVASLSDAEIMQYLNDYAQVDATDLEEHAMADAELASEFLNVSAGTAEAELEYYHLNNLDY